MPRRMAVLILFVALVLGALYFLSTMAKEQPLQTLESDVTANAG